MGFRRLVFQLGSDLHPGPAGVEVRFVRMWMQGVCQSPQAAIFSAVGGYPCFQFLLLLGTDMFVGQVTGQQIVNVFILFHGHLQFTRMDKTMAPMAVIRKGFSAA